MLIKPSLGSVNAKVYDSVYSLCFLNDNESSKLPSFKMFVRFGSCVNAKGGRAVTLQVLVEQSHHHHHSVLVGQDRI